MSLKQSIVIVSEYTTKTSKGGTRGGTPGNYILGYMARTAAIENTTPGIDLMPENGVLKDGYEPGYMTRPDAVEKADDLPEYRRRTRKHELDGVAFGDGDLSLSYRALKGKSKAIQKAFDEGKTVMKTILSFDESYLLENGIIPEGFSCEKEGDYRGNIDQMKLRGAIDAGIKKLGYGYDDLRYVGTVQVDTKHVHCHVAMCDFGPGTLGKDGKQKGKISQKGLSNIRRGMDNYLDENQTVLSLASNVTYDRRNALCYVKSFTHKAMNLNGTPQFLLACLPKDKNKWRAGSKSKEMQKANEIATEYVERLFEQPDSGYADTMRNISAYAAERRTREGLTDKQHIDLVDSMRARLVDDCVNGVYSVLRRVPDNQRPVDTAMMAMMSADFDSLQGRDVSSESVEFAYKLRAYSVRLGHHRRESDRWRGAADSYRSTENIDETTKPLVDFYDVEAEYNEKAMCKYHHFLAFLPPDVEYQKEFNNLMEYKTKMRNLESMMNDPSTARMAPDAAEDYGRRTFGQHGGRFVRESPHIIEQRLEKMGERYAMMEDGFKKKLADYGFSLDDDGISAKKPYEFGDVKAVDLHHLGYDFSYDADVSKVNADSFIELANRRYSAFQSAKDYLVNSGQSAALSHFPEQDIELMKEVADSMSQFALVMQSQDKADGRVKPVKTIKLDRKHCLDIETIVKATVQSVQIEGFD